MNDSKAKASAARHLGMRIAVGVVGLALIALFVLLGSVALRQSDTTRTLETRAPLREGVQTTPVRE